ncbi:MAG: Gfo/Idh/MocA family oxidoreductase [Caldilineaceae bacterium SB0665_bin_25]|nr:Gfo/Idh/MocA family oxidoreductase [Caldilineaceae bacterium SB0665_bin_25]
MPVTYRAGIIGHTGRGNYGHHLDTAFQGLPNVEVVAVADPDEEGRAAAVQRTGASHNFAGYKTMLSQMDLDLVAVCPRWVDQHVDMVIACAQAGVKGIFCEKPFSRTLAEADAMLAACERHNTRIAVAHRRANPYELHAKKLIEDGLIGDIQMIRRHGKADHRAGAMDLAVLGPHLLDNIRFFAASEVAWAHAHVTQDGRELTTADIHEGDEGVGPIAGNGLAAYFVFRNGVTAHLDSYRSDDTDTREQVNWLGLEIHGSAGILSLRLAPLGELYHYPYRLWLPGDRDGAWERITRPEWDLNPDGQPRSVSEKFQLNNRAFVEELIRAVEEDSPVTAVTSGHDARAVHEMIMAIHESQRLRARVEFPLENRENPYVVWRTEAENEKS